MAQNDQGGQLETLADEAASPTKPAFGEQGGTAPLAAVFKTRRRKRKKAQEAEPIVEASPESDDDLPVLEPELIEDLVLDFDELGGTVEEDVAEPVPSAIDTQPMAQFDLDDIDLSPMTADEVDLNAMGDDFDLEFEPDPKAASHEMSVETTAESPVLEMAGPGLGDSIPANADPIWARDAVLSLATEYAAANRTPNEGAWFAEMFGSEYLLASPRRRPEHVEREVEYVERSLNVAADGRILDLCSGFGRHAVPLARRGYEVVGLDLSIDMLQHALARAQAESLSIKFVHGDMRDLNFDEVFDGAYCMDTSFGYFTEVENLNVLRGVWTSLKPGGRFVLDVINRDYALSELPNRNWWEGDGCLVQEDIEFNHMQSRLQIKRYLVFADGNERIYDVSLRLYAVHELVRMLEIAGFEVLDVCGGLDTVGVFFGASSRRLMVTVRRPA